MAGSGLIWRHVTLGTHSSWLPGDPRGWRSRGHKRHSGGDYRNPPPLGEHAGLYRHSREASGSPRTIPPELRERVGSAFLDKLRALNRTAVVLSVGARHVHGLMLLPRDPAAARAVVGRAKQRASHAVRLELPGQVWAEAGGLRPVETVGHLRQVIPYIADHAAEGAWVWMSAEGRAVMAGRMAAREMLAWAEGG